MPFVREGLLEVFVAFLYVYIVRDTLCMVRGGGVCLGEGCWQDLSKHIKKRFQTLQVKGGEKKRIKYSLE